MDLKSLGYRTDLALLQLGGTLIEDRGDHLVLRSSHNPTFWWGNFILLPAPPPAEEAQRWLDVFHETFPDAEHVALGFDGIDGNLEDLAGFAALGLVVERASVMTAQAVNEPPHRNRQATYRALTSGDDWAQLVEIRCACNDDQEPTSHRIFAEAKVNTCRKLTEDGHGAWFGAFVDGRLLSTMGLFRANSGLARFQSVETHPDARGEGLAGTLVHHVSRFGFDELGAHTLVMVADPEYLAIKIYRSVGFEETETQLQAERPPLVINHVDIQL
ncbi:MAG: GNAT family N-acetyltransferase [Nocardioidaceae bacterium]